MSTLADNFAAIEARIVAACARAKRERASVTLIAVSKLHPSQVIRDAYALGQRDFGENYAQELRDKHAELASLPGLRFHAIGPVQTKNAKYVARAATVFHAIDRLEVAQELDRRREGDVLEVLIEVNVAGEASKAGIEPSALPLLLQSLASLKKLKVIGLTTMPPLSEDPEASRPAFSALRALAETNGLKALSMGTTGDFEVAIEEGATLIRVGTALFGNRPA